MEEYDFWNENKKLKHLLEFSDHHPAEAGIGGLAPQKIPTKQVYDNRTSSQELISAI